MGGVLGGSVGGVLGTPFGGALGGTLGGSVGGVSGALEGSMGGTMGGTVGGPYGLSLPRSKGVSTSRKDDDDVIPLPAWADIVFPSLLEHNKSSKSNISNRSADALAIVTTLALF